MKIARGFMLCAATFGMMVPLAMAQDQGQLATPVPPYLASVPDSAHWTVTLSYSTAHPATPGAPNPAVQLNSDQPLTIDIVRGGGFSVATFTFQNSPPVRVDAKGETSFLPTPTDGQLSKAGAQSSISFYTTRFLFAEWLRQQGASAFDKTVVFREIPCFHYVNKQPPNPKIYNPGYGNEVWINVKTMLPVASKWNGVEADFTFLPPPSSPPQLSRDEIDLIQYRENLKQAVDSIR